MTVQVQRHNEVTQLRTFRGVVASWHKCYGFITPDQGGPDIHVRWREIQTDEPGYKYLREGDRVSYQVVIENGRREAVCVQVIR